MYAGSKTTRHKVFTCYHHKRDQEYKDLFVALGKAYDIFIDKSVALGDISPKLKDDTIRRKIRDEYLRNSSVSIVLVGLETKKRKHVDWEIHSSMIDGSVNKKSGILVVYLPTTGLKPVVAPHKDEKEKVYPEIESWVSVGTEEECKRNYLFMPEIIQVNLPEKINTKISVTYWDKVCDGSSVENLKKSMENLRFLTENAANTN
ncbi:MAG: TIR domain-containing protein [Candidatus Poribacteria bacterium]|nr:TIR domain-containing protein [Candidatus Poribacteria bacterium]